MIETEEQRRWWFATHPEFSWSQTKERPKGNKKKEEEEKSEKYTPEDVDAYADEQLKYATGREAEFLKIVKRVAGTEGATQGQDQQSRASEEDRESRDGDERPSRRGRESESDAETPLIFPWDYPVDTVPGLRFPTLRQLARLPVDMIRQFYRILDRLWKSIQLGIDPNSIEGHHDYVEELRDWFLAAGLNPDEYIDPMTAAEHRLKPHGLHTGKGMGRGGWLNHKWRQYKRKNPTATKRQMIRHNEKLKKEAVERMKRFEEMERNSTSR